MEAKGKMYRSGKKKWLALSLLLLLLLFSSSFAVCAAGSVAKIGGRSFSSLQDALKAVKNKQTIKLQKDIRLDSVTLCDGKKFTLDLNKHTISCSSNYLYPIKSGVSNGFLYVKSGELTVKNGTINGEDAAVAIFRVGGGSKKAKLNIQSGTYCGDALRVSRNGTVTVSGGKFYNDSEGGRSYQIYNEGTLVLKNGDFHTTQDMFYNSGKLTIQNGKYAASRTLITQEPANSKITSIPVLTVKKGTFRSWKSSDPYTGGAYISGCGKITVNGGTWKEKSTFITYNALGRQLSKKQAAKSYIKIGGGKVTCTEGIDIVDYNYKSLSYIPVTITGGTITSTTSGTVYAAKVTMKGGKLAVQNGGFAIKAEKIVLSGGILKDASGEGSYRGFVYADKLQMSGGTVYGAVGSRNFTMSGGSIVCDSNVDGHAVYVEDGGTCKLRGGTITVKNVISDNYYDSETGTYDFTLTTGAVDISDEKTTHVSVSPSMKIYYVDGGKSIRL